MKKYIITNIYSSIIDHEAENFNKKDILLKTKRLVANSSKFLRYSKEYQKTTNKLTFKTPDQDIYPLLRNEKYLSLNQKVYNFDSTKTSKTTPIKTKRETSKNMKLLLLSSPSNEISTYEKNIDKTDLLTTRKYRNYNRMNNSNSVTKSTKSCLGHYEKFNKILMNVKMPKKFLFHSIENFKRTTHNEMLFNDIVLNEPSYNKLNFVEYEIFKGPKYYNNFIKEKLSSLKKKLPKNTKSNLSKKYIYSKYNEPILTLTSLSISFNSSGNNKIFYIPFEFLPLFYYKNMMYLRLLLISLVKFNKNYENILIDYDEIPYILKHSKEFQTNENSKSKTNIEKNINQSKLKISSPISKNSNDSRKGILSEDRISIKENRHKRTTTSSEKLIDIFDSNYNFDEIPKDKKNIIYSDSLLKSTYCNCSSSYKNLENLLFNNKISSTKKENKTKLIFKQNHIENIYNCFYTQFKYKWITPKYSFDITVQTPEISFKLENILFKASISIELILFLLENNFENWDYHVSNYIFSFKYFIKYIGTFLTKNPISLHRPKTGDVKTKKKILNNDIINLTQPKIFEFSDKNTKFEFLYTNENNDNAIKTFHNFSTRVTCKKINPIYDFCFNFRFYQMRILNNILKIQNLTCFLRKLLYFDKINKKIIFKYEDLNSFSKGQYKNLETCEPNKTTTQICFFGKENTNEDLNIKINFPTLETIHYFKNSDTSEENCYISDYASVKNEGILLSVLDELCKAKFEKWPIILLGDQKIKNGNRKFTVNSSPIRPKHKNSDIKKKISSTLINRKELY